MFKKLVFVLALILTNYSGAFASDLLVEVIQVPSANGSVELQLFDSAGGERLGAPVIIMRQPAAVSGVSIFRVGGLLPGLYAVTVYHDEDNSGSPNMGFRGSTEASAISNLQQRPFRSPRFTDTAFALPENGISITMTLQK